MSLPQTLIFGPGWIGEQFAQQIATAELSRVDIGNEDAVSREIDRVKPARIINCAGKTGRPNIDACEKDPEATYRSNVVAPIVLAIVAHQKGIHLTHMSSGCLYEGDGGGNGFREDDPHNFLGSVYSRSKSISETALREFDALQFRVRMPISEVPGPRNLLTKLSGFTQVIHEPNSVTVLEDFFPVALKLIEKGETGVFNMVNEGLEYHDELLELYRELVDPKHTYEVISVDELRNQLSAGRSNCILNTEKLRRAGHSLPDLRESLPRLVKAYGEHVKKR